MGGESEALAFVWASTNNPLEIKLDFGLNLAWDSLEWRLHVRNVSGYPVYLDSVTMLDTEGSHSFLPWARSSSGRAHPGNRFSDAPGIGLGTEEGNWRFYSNGWQSWSYAGTIGAGERFPRSRLGPLHSPVQLNAATPRPRRPGHAVSDMFGVLGDRHHAKGLLAGFLSQKQAFGTLECRLGSSFPTLRMWMSLDGVRLDEGQEFETDWAWLSLVNLDEIDPMGSYLSAVASANHARQNEKPPVGWCSWYQYYEDVTEADLLSNLEWVRNRRRDIPLEVFQLDDGFESQVGDWDETKEGFGGGLEAVSARIREAGFLPGLWLAPFLAKRGSRMARSHRQWILRNHCNIPVNAGFLWNSFPVVLDVTHPEVLDYLKGLIGSAVRQLGFGYLKLDFLYAGALPGKHDSRTVTRAQALSQALQVIREAAGEDVQLLGCGCPLGSGIGIFDAMRINPDVAPRWRPAYWGVEAVLRDEFALPAARNALLVAINRLPLHQRWWVNDPDCLLIRSKDTHLTSTEVQTLASVIAMSAGSLFVSDDLTMIDEERLAWLMRMIPPLPRAARALDWFDHAWPSQLALDLQGADGWWKLVALINWRDYPADLILEVARLSQDLPDHLHLIDFWNESYARVTSNRIHFLEVPSHGVRAFSVRPVRKGAQWLGDTLHFSQGLALKAWQESERRVLAILDLKRNVQGKAWVQLPSKPLLVSLSGEEVGCQQIEEKIWVLTLEFSGEAKLEFKL